MEIGFRGERFGKSVRRTALDPGIIAAIYRLMIANLAQIVAASYGRGSRPGCRGVVVSDFIAAASGTRMATCVGGVLTGRGADIAIIDDPLVRAT